MLLELIKSDLLRFEQTYRLRKQPYSKAKVLVESFLFKAGFQAVFLYRISHSFYKVRLNYVAWFITRLNLFLTGAEIEFNAEIGPSLFIAHPNGIVIGRGTRMGSFTTLFQGVSFGVKDWHPQHIKYFPQVGDHCTFFAHSAVYGGVNIGNYCVVAGHSVVVIDMPEGSFAIGVPAKLLPRKGKEKTLSWEGGMACAE